MENISRDKFTHSDLVILINVNPISTFLKLFIPLLQFPERSGSLEMKYSNCVTDDIEILILHVMGDTLRWSPSLPTTVNALNPFPLAQCTFLKIIVIPPLYMLDGF